MQEISFRKIGPAENRVVLTIIIAKAKNGLIPQLIAQ